MKFNSPASTMHVYQDPSPEEIEKRAKEIRANWSENERRSRAVGFSDWGPPMISIGNEKGSNPYGERSQAKYWRMTCKKYFEYYLRKRRMKRQLQA